MMRIETQRPRIPWTWAMWITLPWVSLFYIENVSTTGPLTFTLRKFVENPFVISLLMSLNVAFNFLVGVTTSYLSDRLWTKWGRRRPFLIVGWTGVALSMACIPFATNLWALVAIIVVYQFCADIAKPVEPLYNEVVPPSQRGRAAVIRTVAQNLMGMFFFGVMLAQFDRVHQIDTLGFKFSLGGETVLYWTGSALVLSGVIFLLFFVREVPPPEGIQRERFAFKTFFRDIFGQRQWWNLYMLYATPFIAAPGVDLFKPLLQTEQLGFSKGDIGWATMLGMIVAMFVFVPIAGFLADKTSRLRIFQVGLLGPGLVNLVLYLYLRYTADYSISFSSLVAFGLAAIALQTCLYVVWGPLMYDYIPSSRFGTVSAGLTFVSGIVPFVVMNIAGAWVKGFTHVFGTPGAGTSDYSSIYLLQFIGAIAALSITFRFASEERRRHILPLGRMEALEKAQGAEATRETSKA